MADVTQYQFDLPEVAALLVKKQGIKEGLWTIGVNFGLSPIQGGPDAASVRPGMIVIVDKLQLTRAEAPGPLTLDAATIK